MSEYRGGDKAQNTRGRRDLRTWRKVTKIKRKGSPRAKVKINKCRTRGLRRDVRGRSLRNCGAGYVQMVRQQRTLGKRRYCILCKQLLSLFQAVLFNIFWRQKILKTR
jgi:hypothetical protein